MLLDPFLNLPAQKLAMFSKNSKHCWEETSPPPLQLQQCIPAPPARAISLLLLLSCKSLCLSEKPLSTESDPSEEPLSTESDPCITISY